MGFKGASRKGGGGIFNNKDYRFDGYKFTTEGPGESDREDLVYLVPEFVEDGADGAQSQHLFLGTAEGHGKDGLPTYRISEDGLSCEMVDGDGEVVPFSYGANLPAGRFLDTLVNDAEFPENLLPDLEAGDALNLEAVIGWRMRLVQEEDEAAMAKFGPRKDANGREWPRTRTIVNAVYEPEGKPAKGAAKGKAAAAPAKAAKAGKPSSKPAAGDDDDSNDDGDAEQLAVDTITAALSKAPKKTLAKSKLAVEFVKLGRNPLRDPAKEYAANPAWLATRDEFTFNKKTNTLTLA